MFRTFFEETKLHFISMKLATSILVKYCKGIVEMNTKYIPPHMWFLFTFIKQVLEKGEDAVVNTEDTVK